MEGCFQVWMAADKALSSGIALFSLQFWWSFKRSSNGLHSQPCMLKYNVNFHTFFPFRECHMLMLQRKENILTLFLRYINSKHILYDFRLFLLIYLLFIYLCRMILKLIDFIEIIMNSL